MKPLTKLCLWLALALMLAACRDSSSDNDDSDTAPEPETGPQPIYPGLVVNPTFELREDTQFLDRPWSFTQHATADSYTYEIENEALKLIRTGHEPWGQISQRIATTEFAGERMRYSAWLKASLDDSFEPGFETTGLAISVYGRSANPMAGSSLLFSRDSAVPVEFGNYGWARHDLEFDLPDHASHVEIRFRLTRGGWIKVKHPSLLPIDAEPKSGPITQEPAEKSRQ